MDSANSSFNLSSVEREICIAGVDYSVRDIKKHQEYHANFAEFGLTPYQPAFYMTKGFYTWWTNFYSNNMFDTAQINERLTKAFSLVQETPQKVN